MQPIRYLLLAVVLGLVCHFASQGEYRVRPAFSELQAQTQGMFPEGRGWGDDKPLPAHRPVRAWGSWAGAEANTGSLALGPFAAPDRIRFGLRGYPWAGNEFFLERATTGERAPMSLPGVGQSWRIVDYPVPPAWRGEPIVIHAIDRGVGESGWIAITEPIVGDRSGTLAPFLTTLATGLLNTALLGLLWLAACALVPRLGELPAYWQPLLATALVALAGYLIFWAFFAGPLMGKLSLGMLYAAAIGMLVRTRKAPIAPEPQQAQRDVIRLGLLIGTLYVALLHVFPSAIEFYELSANRFRHSLPADNSIPYAMSRRLHAGESLRSPPLFGDWLSSDRPPLQSGWQLLTLPVTAALKLDGEVASGTAAIWLQLAWVPAAYGFLQALGLSVVRASGWTALLACTGFLLQNTAFPWPKLCAGAFACGAFGFWVIPNTRTLRLTFIGAGLAALAWLAHGGVAFSFLVLAPWVLWRMSRGEWRMWLAAAALFFVMVLPWSTYQRLYDPPGNRLLKWHLAGQIELDTRGTWQTLRENYAKLDSQAHLKARAENFAMQKGHWPSLFTVSERELITRRNAEFFHSSRALAWWAFAAVLAPLVWWRIRGVDTARRAHLATLLWVAFTVPVWCLLMFAPQSAIIHQGSYAMMLAAFALLSVWFDLVGRWALGLVTVLQLGTFLTTWAVASPVVGGAPRYFPVALAATAGVGLIAYIVQALRAPPTRL